MPSATQKASRDVNSSFRGVVVKSNSVSVAAQPNNQQHVIVKADPQFYKPVDAVQTPDGGAGWIFVLAAAITIAWAVIKRSSAEVRSRS
jgi:hypothetical protein